MHRQPASPVDRGAVAHAGPQKRSPPGNTFLTAITVEPTVGVEPTTCRLRIGCSTSELRWRKSPAAVSFSEGLAASCFWWPGADLNRRHHDFQSCALPTELPGRVRGLP